MRKLFYSLAIVLGITILVIFGISLNSSQNSESYAETYLELTFDDISNFNEEEIIHKIRERLLNEPNLQNQKFDYLESLYFPKLNTNDNGIAIVFPIEFSKDSEELQVIINSLYELESIVEVSEPKLIFTSVDPW